MTDATTPKGELIKVSIHQSLIKIMMFLGGERKLVIVLIALSFYAGFVLSFRFHVLVGAPIGIGSWLLGILILRKLAETDNQMSEVAVRHFKYRDFYPARARFDSFQPNYPDYK
jgi:type IV secretion system protein VirB3